MKTWTNPTVEELEVELTAGGFWPYFYESKHSHGVNCGCPSNPDGDPSDGDLEIPEDEGTPS